jgi:hypothetical protein
LATTRNLVSAHGDAPDQEKHTAYELGIGYADKKPVADYSNEEPNASRSPTSPKRKSDAIYVLLNPSLGYVFIILLHRPRNHGAQQGKREATSTKYVVD